MPTNGCEFLQFGASAHLPKMFTTSHTSLLQNEEFLVNVKNTDYHDSFRNILSDLGGEKCWK